MVWRVNYTTAMLFTKMKGMVCPTFPIDRIMCVPVYLVTSVVSDSLQPYGP